MAIASGIFNSLGTVFQKKVVNERKSDEKFVQSLFKNKLWLAGFLLQLAAGSALFVVAQTLIGPVLTPGLMATGLIVLAIGAVRIANEKLGTKEKCGIVLMIMAIAFLGFSNLSVDLSKVDFLDIGFIFRMVTFSGILFLASVGFRLFANRKKAYRGVLLSIVAGFMISLSNFWISVLIGTIVQVFSGNAILIEWILFIISAGILIITNLYATIVLQEGFKTGQASTLIPIEQIPIQITPIFVYYAVFMAYLMTPVEPLSPVWMVFGVGLIIVSSFMLGEQQAKMEAIK